ncbi:MAG: hypothetical protein ACR2PT_10470 [Endozoicomonas sp.]
MLFILLSSPLAFSINQDEVENALVFFANGDSAYECTGIRQSEDNVVFKQSQCNLMKGAYVYNRENKNNTTPIGMVGDISTISVGVTGNYSSALLNATVNQTYMIPTDTDCSSGIQGAELFYFNNTNTSMVMSTTVNVTCTIGNSLCNFTLPTRNMTLNGEPLLTKENGQFSLFCFESSPEGEHSQFQCQRLTHNNCPTPIASSSASAQAGTSTSNPAATPTTTPTNSAVFSVYSLYTLLGLLVTGIALQL